MLVELAHSVQHSCPCTVERVAEVVYRVLVELVQCLCPSDDEVTETMKAGLDTTDVVSLMAETMEAELDMAGLDTTDVVSLMAE